MKHYSGGLCFRTALVMAACVLALPSAFGAKVGDTLDQVLAEKGAPKSQIAAGETRVLSYADMKVKLKADVVVSISAVAPAAKTNANATTTASSSVADSETTATATPAAAGKNSPAALGVQRRLRRAIEIVQNIVNQPVEAIPIKPGMQVASYGDYWFHPGALRPDFAHIDVRATQESSYSQFRYVTSKLNPGVAFEGPTLEFNAMLKLFYIDRNLPKKKLTEREMLEINQQYRVIAQCEAELAVLNEPRK